MALIGFGGYQGDGDRRPAWGSPAEVMTVPPAREGSVEWRLHELLPERAVLIFGGDPTSPAGSPRVADHRAIGVVYDPSFERWGNYVPSRLGRPLRRLHLVRRLHRPAPAARPDHPGELETYPAGV